MKVSYLEIYNEDITDLLNPENTKLKIHEDLERGIFVGGVQEEVVSTASQVLALLHKGEGNRKVGQTNMSEVSSRSHSIFRISMISRAPESEEDTTKPNGKRGSSTLGGGSMIVSSLNLVDLAGSERISHTGAEGVRLKEGAHINKSLFTLERVIKKLSDPKSGGRHIPYRDSKLTRILQSALGGNSKTAIICTMTPSILYADESQRTLKFASSAKNIVTRPQINEICKDKNIKQKYEKKISSLQDQISELMKKLGGRKEAELIQLLEDARRQLDEKEKEIMANTLHGIKRRKVSRNARRLTWSHSEINRESDDETQDADETMDSEKDVKDSLQLFKLKQDLQQAQQELETLQQKMQEQEKSLKEAQEDQSTLQDELETSHQMVESLRIENDTMEVMKLRQEEYIEDIRKKTLKIRELEALNEEEIDVSNQLIEELDHFNGECIKMIETNIKNEEERRHFEMRISDLERALREKATQHLETTQQLQEKVQQLEQLTDEINAVRVDRDEYMDRCAHYDKMIDANVTEMQELKQIKDSLESEVLALKDEIMRIQSESETETEAVEMEELLLSEIEQLNRSNSDLESRIGEFQSKLATFDQRGETIRHLEAQLVTMKEHLSNMEIEHWEGENKVTLAEIAQMQLEDQLTSVKAENQSIHEKLQSQVVVVEELKNQVLDLEFNNEELRTLKRITEEKAQTLVTKKQQLKSELEEKTRMIHDLSEEKDRMIQEWVEMKEHMLHNFALEKENEIAQWRQEKEDLLQSLETQQSQIDRHEEVRTQLQRQMEEKEQSLFQLMEERESALHVLIEEKDETLERLEKENRHLREQLEELDALRIELKSKHTLEEEMTTLKQSQQEDALKLTQSQEENKELTVMLEELLVKSERLSEEKEAMAKRMESQEAQSQDRKELEEMKEAVEHYKNVINDYNKMFEEQGKKLESMEEMKLQLAKYKLYAKNKKEEGVRMKKVMEEQKRRFEELRKEAEKVRDENIRLSKSRMTVVDKENINPYTNKPVNI